MGQNGRMRMLGYTRVRRAAEDAQLQLDSLGSTDKMVTPGFGAIAPGLPDVPYSRGRVPMDREAYGVLI